MERTIQLRQKYDRLKDEWVFDEIPTTTIKAARSVGGAHGGTAMFRKVIGPGTAIRVTFMAFGRRGGTPEAAAGLFWMIDGSEGTFDFPMLESDGREVLLGALDSPVHVIGPGTFNVFVGSAAGGSYFFAFEGVIHQSGSETVHGKGIGAGTYGPL